MREARLTPLLAVLLTAGAHAQNRHATRRVADTELQQAINDSIRAGTGYLRRTQREGGTWSYQRLPGPGWPGMERPGDSHTGGLTALALYALASSGVADDDAAVQRGIAWCRQNPEPFASGTRATYSASLLVLALCRIDPKAHRKWIHALADRIADSQLANGMWNYLLRAPSRRVARGPWQNWLNDGDNSNTQFAVLALWTAQIVTRFRVPSKVWKKVQALYARTQQADGGWSYKGRRPRDTSDKKRPLPGRQGRPGAPVWMFRASPTMTAAGLVSHTCATAALTGGVKGLAKARVSKVVKLGKDAFLASKDGWDRLMRNYYFCYSVERVGTVLAVPESEWYARLAKTLVALQSEDGRWRRSWSRDAGFPYGDRDQVYETSLALLCLSKATATPITPRK